MNEDNKRNTTLWLRPSTIQRMDSWLAEDNCQSRSEFVEKALRFYMGYLGSDATSISVQERSEAVRRHIHFQSYPDGDSGDAG